MKHEFNFTSYQEDGVFNVGIKCNRPFRVMIGDDDTTYDEESNYDGDGEHIIYMQFPFDVDVKVVDGLIDIDGRRLIVEVFDFGLWDLTLDEKKNALLHNGHLKNLWIESDFTQMMNEGENEINKLISELEDLFSDTIPSSVYQPSLKCKWRFDDGHHQEVEWDGYMHGVGESSWNGWDVIKVDKDTLDAMIEMYKDDFDNDFDEPIYSDVIANGVDVNGLYTLDGYTTMIVG